MRKLGVMRKRSPPSTTRSCCSSSFLVNSYSNIITTNSSSNRLSAFACIITNPYLKHHHHLPAYPSYPINCAILCVYTPIMPSMHLFTFGILALLLPNALAAPTSNTAAYAVKERHDAPQGWTKITSPVEYQTISLQIALKQQNSDALTKIALEVSDPSHPRYGQYLSAKQVRDLVAPSNATIDAVFG